MSLELAHVAVSYGKTPILRDITARLEQGQIVGLIGPNGTGKSTLIKSIATVQRFSGTIHWQGAPVSLRDIGFMPPGERGAERAGNRAARPPRTTRSARRSQTD